MREASPTEVTSGRRAHPKRAAADRAVDQVRSGMVVGLGAGPTARFAVIRMAARIADRSPTDVVGVPCSCEVEEEAGGAFLREKMVEQASRRVIIVVDASKPSPALGSRRPVPVAVVGIAFLSGGQPPDLASARLNAMNARFKSRLPWALAFSFARAIQQPALKIWRGEQAYVSAAQQALCHRARRDSAARRGEYGSAMEGPER